MSGDKLNDAMIQEEPETLKSCKDGCETKFGKSIFDDEVGALAAAPAPDDIVAAVGTAMGGGRRHKGSKKAHKTRKGNNMLKSWVAFVKKVQHEEKISYSDAMSRASKRKSEWKRGQMGGSGATATPTPYPPPRATMSGGWKNTTVGSNPGPPPNYKGGRRTKRRGTKKRRGSRRR